MTIPDERQPVEDRRPMRARCGACEHRWDAAYLPMTITKVARLLARLTCPSCGEGERIFVSTEREP